MRSILSVVALAVSIAAPVSAVASTPNTFTSPMSVVHQPKDRTVFVTFVNYTAQDRELLIGGTVYKIGYYSSRHVLAPVGSVVRTYSAKDSKLNGNEWMTLSAGDADKSFLLK